MTTASGTANAARNYRIQPSVAVAVGIVVAYMLVVTSIPLLSGIGYDEWFESTGNVWRTAIPALGTGSLLLLALLAWTRWDMLWRDPARLPMSPLLWAPAVVMGALIVPRLAGIEWGAVPVGLLLSIFLAGVLVGFAEEMCLRGFFLRGMRTNGRNEGSAALWTAVVFGLFHLPNVFLGTGAIGLVQMVFAGLSGVAFYLFRRGFASIVPAMVVHGIWDISLFIPDDYSGGIATSIAQYGVFALYGVALFVLIVIVRRDRNFAVTPEGIVPAGDAAPPRVR